MYLQFAWRYFKAKKSANAINIIAWVTVGVIAFATCCQVLVLSVFNGFEGLVKSLYASFYTDIKIIPAKGKTIILTPQQLTQIKQQSFVQNFSLIAEEKALLQNSDGDESQTVISLKGVDDNYGSVSGVAAKTSQGKFNTGTVDEPGIVLGAGIQYAANVSLSAAYKTDHLTVIVPKKNSGSDDPLQSLSEGNLEPTGVFTIQQDFDSKYAITNIGFVKQQMGLDSNEYTAVELKLNNTVSIDIAKEKLTALMGNNYTVQTLYQQNMSLYNTMKLERWFIFAVFTLILIVSAFTMISALTMLVLEKQKDISVLQSMGASRSAILKIFLSEGLLLGGIGAAIGIAMATILCLAQLKFKLIKMGGGSFLIDYYPVKLIAGDFLLVTVTAAVIAFIASWFPARKAAGQAFELR
ncbi:FtsX-like permease family protein [Ferruginibacter sp. SUN106]|uniref:FtsX-like permease family protein n=1 Tax=Ferruginibacter sp. SUN106 TaxID=2978348 RepID=UPI003D35E9D3